MSSMFCVFVLAPHSCGAFVLPYCHPERLLCHPERSEGSLTRKLKTTEYELFIYI